MSKNGCRSTAECRMAGYISREIGYTGQCFYTGIELRRPWIEIKILCIPAHNSCITECHIQQGHISRPSYFAEIFLDPVFCGNGIPVARRCVRAYAVGPEMNDADTFAGWVVYKIK